MVMSCLVWSVDYIETLDWRHGRNSNFNLQLCDLCGATEANLIWLGLDTFSGFQNLYYIFGLLILWMSHISLVHCAIAAMQMTLVSSVSTWTNSRLFVNQKLSALLCKYCVLYCIWWCHHPVEMRPVHAIPSTNGVSLSVNLFLGKR